MNLKEDLFLNDPDEQIMSGSIQNRDTLYLSVPPITSPSLFSPRDFLLFRAHLRLAPYPDDIILPPVTYNGSRKYLNVYRNLSPIYYIVRAILNILKFHQRRNQIRLTYLYRSYKILKMKVYNIINKKKKKWKEAKSIKNGPTEYRDLPTQWTIDR